MALQAAIALRRLRILQAFPAHVRTIRTRIDERIDKIAEQYALTKDELEIAYEETQKNTVYASEDREVAREELGKLEKMYELAVTEEGEEVERRIGQRVREIRNAIGNLEAREERDK